MINPPLKIRCQNSDLYAVPAKHFCHVFATEVNRICRNPATRPDAIAVELGPDTAAAASQWLKELGIGQDGGSVLPVMLGLIRPNRMIRPSLREKVICLQRETGRDLTELSPDMLHRELGFNGHSAIFLSPVDSIIEALRCAIELGVPVYGVDLEESASGVYGQAVIQDPQAANRNMAGYLTANLPLAGAMRDLEVDPRREIAMAARIKQLAQQHRKVLFTCGMAHWLKIEEMLADESVKPAPIMINHGKGQDEFTRTVVHPVIAARHMDLFPALAQVYEKCRAPATCGARPSMKTIQTEALFRGCLRQAYTKYFSSRIPAALLAKRSFDLESIPAFEAYVWGIRQLNHHATPDLFMILDAAYEIMSSDFATALADTFMDFPWTSPGNHPGCPLLMPPDSREQETDCLTLVEGGFPNRRNIYINTIPAGDRSRQTLRIAYEWDKSEGTTPLPILYTWRPWEYLISSLSFQAIQAGWERQLTHKPTVFEGSFLDGIDVKSTLRAYSRGKECMYMRDLHYEAKSKSISAMDGFPVVWILHPGPQKNSEWKTLIEPSWLMEKHAKDIHNFRANLNIKGNYMVASIGYGQSRLVDRSEGTGEIVSFDYYHGILIFQPICWTNRQFARWAELTNCRRNPFYGNGLLNHFCAGNLKASCERDHGIRLDESDWITTLILTALPFCRDRLTVVMSEKCSIEPIVRQRARKYGVRLSTTPLALFTADQISRLEKCQMVPAISAEPETRYSESIEKAIGEKQTQNRELVPPEWLNFCA